MQWLPILLIGVAANIDNLVISVSYGLKLNRIPLVYNLIISLTSVVFAFISITAGSYLSSYFSQSIVNFIGGSLIIILGIWFIVPSFVFVKNERTQIDDTQTTSVSLDKPKTISLKESLFLGFVLALNGFTIGFGAGIIGVSPLFTSISIGVFSLISIYLGIKVGNKIGDTLFGKYTSGVAGILLIFIGVFELFFI